MLQYRDLRDIATAFLLKAANLPPVRFWQASRLRKLAAQAPAGHVKLNLGCGKRAFLGWINVDLVPSSPGPDVVLDLRRQIPLSDGTVDLIYSEDLLEHLELSDGRRMLSECYRVLRGGGIMRLLTPDLRLLATHYVKRCPDLLRWYGDQYGTRYFAEVLNHGMRSWGHRFIYDHEMLTRELRAMGFIPRRQSLNQSACSELRGLDRAEPQEAQFRMYLDCAKPPA